LLHSIPLAPISPAASPPTAARVAAITFEEAIKALYAPLLAPITASVFVDPADGDAYYLPGEPIWSNPLGKDLCIVDIDTRPLNETHQLLNEDFNWQTAEGVSVGMLNHYIYGIWLHQVMDYIVTNSNLQLLSTVMITNLSIPLNGTMEPATMFGQKSLLLQTRSNLTDL
jgi:hypothetical protein